MYVDTSQHYRDRRKITRLNWSLITEQHEKYRALLAHSAVSINMLLRSLLNIYIKVSCLYYSMKLLVLYFSSKCFGLSLNRRFHKKTFSFCILKTTYGFHFLPEHHNIFNYEYLLHLMKYMQLNTLYPAHSLERLQSIKIYLGKLRCLPGILIFPLVLCVIEFLNSCCL